jgi:hypothetical protein
MVFRRNFWIHLVVWHFLAKIPANFFHQSNSAEPPQKGVWVKESALNLLFRPEFQRNSNSRRILIPSVFLQGNSSRLKIRILFGKTVDFANQMVNVTVECDRRALMRKSLLRITRVSSCSADLLPTAIMDNQFSLFSSFHLFSYLFQLNHKHQPIKYFCMDMIRFELNFDVLWNREVTSRHKLGLFSLILYSKIGRA